MEQLSFPWSKDFGRTLPPRFITSVNDYNPFIPNKRWLQLSFNFDATLAKKQRRANTRRKKFFFKGKKAIPCIYCGKELSFNQASIEHIVQLSKGGLDKKSNMTISCLPCNHMRQDFSFEEWEKIVQSGFRDKRPYHFKDPFLRLIVYLKERGRFIERRYLK